jgi:hypothetical protein
MFFHFLLREPLHFNFFKDCFSGLRAGYFVVDEFLGGVGISRGDRRGRV